MQQKHYLRIYNLVGTYVRTTFEQALQMSCFNQLETQ